MFHRIVIFLLSRQRCHPSPSHCHPQRRWFASESCCEVEGPAFLCPSLCLCRLGPRVTNLKSAQHQSGFSLWVLYFSPTHVFQSSPCANSIGLIVDGIIGCGRIVLQAVKILMAA